MALQGAPGIRIPKLLYGTAWKKDRTADLVYQALKAGFRGIDTAAQPRHYREKLVGDGIRRAISEGIVSRENLYIQTKYTPISGQDPENMPYSASQSLADQVHTSIVSSLSNFAPPDINSSSDIYIDCLVLHSPLPTIAQTHEVWQALESYVPSKVRALGISNTTLPALSSLFSDARISPSVVQNRFYPATKWEGEIRRLCREKGIVFQAFWTLSGNPGLIKNKAVGELAQQTGVEREVAVYALVLGLKGLTILNGTTSEERMTGDLEGIEIVGKWAEGMGEWGRILRQFKGLIGEVDDL